MQKYHRVPNTPLHLWLMSLFIDATFLLTQKAIKKMKNEFALGFMITKSVKGYVLICLIFHLFFFLIMLRTLNITVYLTILWFKTFIIFPKTNLTVWVTSFTLNSHSRIWSFDKQSNIHERALQVYIQTKWTAW